MQNRKRTDPRANPDLLQIGKLPPQDIELEAAVLGGILIQKDAIEDIIDIFKPEIFYSDANKLIANAILNLYSSPVTSPIDILTVTNELKQTGKLEKIGGAFYIAKLTQRIASANNIAFHCRIVLERYIKRKIIETANQAMILAYSDETDALELLAEHEKEVENIFSLVNINNFQSVSELYYQALQRNEEIIQKQGVSGIPAGFIDLDRITGGWQKTDLIIIAARPGMGKTALAMTMARNSAAMFKIPVAVFSLEMSNSQLMSRLGSSETEIPLEKILRKGLNEEETFEYKSKMQVLKSSPLYIDDTPGLAIHEFKIKAKKMKKDLGIELIVIDYIQLMKAGVKSDNRVAEVSYISSSLKAIAKELKVTIIALSQLSRAVEGRPDKKPILSDLRESGSIEQDADMVIFLYRPEYYNIQETTDGESTKGLAELIIAKHRNGALTDVYLEFQGQFTKFKDVKYSNEETFNNLPLPTKINIDRNDKDIPF